MPKIRLLALDLDGTVLDSSRRLSTGSAEAMQEAQRRGIIVCMASGRSIATIRPFQKDAGITGPIVSSNGSYVVDEAGEEVHSMTLSAETSAFLLDLARQRNIHTNIYRKEVMHLTAMNEFAAEYLRRTGLPSNAVMGPMPEGELPSKLLFMDRPEVIQDLEQELRGLMGPEKCHIVRSESDYLEFLPAGISKGRGLAVLADRLGVAPEETAALGDYWNDQEMIEWAGFSGAMGTAPDEIKAKAAVVVGANDQGGAADFIRQVLSLGSPA